MSPDIEIISPICLRLAISEIQEDRFPSFKVELECVLQHPTGTFAYSAGDVWFSNDAWDAFSTALSDVIQSRRAEAELCDLSEAFLLKVVARPGEAPCVSLECSEPDTGQGQGKLSLCCPTDREALAALAAKVDSFPKWW